MFLFTGVVAFDQGMQRMLATRRATIRSWFSTNTKAVRRSEVADFL